MHCEETAHGKRPAALAAAISLRLVAAPPRRTARARRTDRRKRLQIRREAAPPPYVGPRRRLQHGRLWSRAESRSKERRPHLVGDAAELPATRALEATLREKRTMVRRLSLIHISEPTRRTP